MSQNGPFCEGKALFSSTQYCRYALDSLGRSIWHFLRQLRYQIKNEEDIQNCKSNFISLIWLRCYPLRIQLKPSKWKSIIVLGRNGLSIQTDRSVQLVEIQRSWRSSLIRVCNVCHSFCILRLHYCMLNQTDRISSNYSYFKGVRMFWIFSVVRRNGCSWRVSWDWFGEFHNWFILEKIVFNSLKFGLGHDHLSQHMRLWYLSHRRPAKLRWVCPSAQSRQSLRCSHT